MPGTRAGGLKTAERNRQLYGDDYYARIGRKGGQNGNTGGFYGNRERAIEAGRKGGMASKRGSETYQEYLDENKKRIRYLYHYRKYSLPQIAEALDVGYSSLLKWAHQHIRDYGAKKR